MARGVGDVTYTQCSTSAAASRRTSPSPGSATQHFRVVTGTAFGARDAAWLRRQAARRRHDVGIADVTGAVRSASRCGGRAARDILQRADRPPTSPTPAFPFMTAQEITVGDVPVRALRVTFVGELGWELYAPSRVRR